ncbi:MAG: ATP-binding protein [Muribaculaceae bacterium]|nr:ATP-binding protein [Muribaculaceae bacterium]
MNIEYLKSIIVMRQQEFPVSLIERENPLPVDYKRIITVPGVRRCGKSSKMELVVNLLLAQGTPKENILWIGFDDERLLSMKMDELDSIIQAYRELYPQIELSQVYCFFDEIQLIEGWEFFVMRIYKHYSKHIYVSGSNATMLSGELKSSLRGWADDYETYPLSFKEYCRFKGIDYSSYHEKDRVLVKNAFREFNNEGGFPESVLTDNLFQKLRLLQGYFDTMLLKDLAEHYGISNTEVLRYFLKRIMENITKPTSIRNIHNDIKSRHLKVSKDNLYEWINHACEIFLFIRVPNYSRSLQKIENSQPKYYCIDNGLRDAVILPQSLDDGKKLENTVFLELKRRMMPSDKIFYFQGKTECDFVIQKGINIESLIQVSWNINEEETREREIKGLMEASETTGCQNLLIITLDDEEEIIIDNKTIKVIPAWKWILSLT